MALDKKALFLLVQNKAKISEIIIDNKKYSADSSELVYSDVPVNRPTTRGGVFFSDTMAFKSKVFVSDPTLSKVLPKTMLGPNQEFAQIELILNHAMPMRVFANLTNYAQKNAGFELSLILVDTSPK